jgi:Zinc finger, C3HC4 type (RING finger)
MHSSYLISVIKAFITAQILVYYHCIMTKPGRRRKRGTARVTVTQLRQQLRELGLSHHGSRQKLEMRLSEYHDDISESGNNGTTKSNVEANIPSVFEMDTSPVVEATNASSHLVQVPSSTSPGPRRPEADSESDSDCKAHLRRSTFTVAAADSCPDTCSSSSCSSSSSPHSDSQASIVVPDRASLYEQMVIQSGILDTCESDVASAAAAMVKSKSKRTKRISQKMLPEPLATATNTDTTTAAAVFADNDSDMAYTVAKLRQELQQAWRRTSDQAESIKHLKKKLRAGTRELASMHSVMQQHARRTEEAEDAARVMRSRYADLKTHASSLNKTVQTRNETIATLRRKQRAIQSEVKQLRQAVKEFELKQQHLTSADLSRQLESDQNELALLRGIATLEHCDTKQLYELSQIHANASAAITAEMHRRITKHNHEQADGKLCRICCDSEADTAFQPCSHCVSCADCAKKLSRCPICRRNVEARIRVFFP